MTPTDTASPNVAETIPADAAMIMSALEVGAARPERRRAGRTPSRSTVSLWLFGSGGGREITLFSRDLSQQAMGFITRDRLTLGSRGTVEVSVPGQATQRIQCTVVRCREVSADWFEGSLRFCA